MDFHPIAGVVWYAVGRFYEANDDSIEDLGYFAHLGGVEGPLFSGPPGEATAFFTFRADRFRARTTLQNGDLLISLDTTGGFTLYFNPHPCGDFSKPETFSRGQPIARFERVYTTAETTVGSLVVNLFTAALRSSEDFTFRGKTWNLRHFFPEGITQLGTASARELPPLPGYKKILPFLGSAMALGGNVRAR